MKDPETTAEIVNGIFKQYVKEKLVTLVRYEFDRHNERMVPDNQGDYIKVDQLSTLFGLEKEWPSVWDDHNEPPTMGA